MLEFNNSENEGQNYADCENSLLHNYAIKIMVMKNVIDRHGLPVFLEQEKPQREDAFLFFLELPIDERREIASIMDRCSNYSEKQLAKVFFRESEYYPRWS